MAAIWTHDENKLFERGIAVFDHESLPDLFENIRKLVPNKTIQEVEQHYRALENDLRMIELGAYDLTLPPMNYVDLPKKKTHRWTEEEHRKFLRGLEKRGRGNWKGIAREFVPSRTSFQVASHAQKYFIKIKKEQKQYQQHQEIQQQQQLQQCSSSYAQNEDYVVVLNCNKAGTSSRGPVLGATMVTPHDASGPGVSDVAHHQPLN